jgi:hypothetical protein
MKTESKSPKMVVPGIKKLRNSKSIYWTKKKSSSFTSLILFIGPKEKLMTATQWGDETVCAVRRMLLCLQSSNMPIILLTW